jgi:hypothetical protein
MLLVKDQWRCRSSIIVFHIFYSVWVDTQSRQKNGPDSFLFLVYFGALTDPLTQKILSAQINRRTSVLFRRYRVFIRRSASILLSRLKIIPQFICGSKLETKFKEAFYHNSPIGGLWSILGLEYRIKSPPTANGDPQAANWGLEYIEIAAIGSSFWVENKSSSYLRIPKSQKVGCLMHMQRRQEEQILLI